MLVLVLFLLHIAGAHATTTTYSVSIRTAGISESGTDSKILILFKGTNGAYTPSYKHLDTARHDDFETSEVDEYTLQLEDVGEIQCVLLATLGKDMFLVDWVAVYSHTHSTTRYFYNTANQGISMDTTEGIQVLKMCRQGEATYTIGTQTGGSSDADTDAIHVKAKIIGSKGSTITGFLDGVDKDVFEEDAFDRFKFRTLKDVGEIRCLELFAFGKDAWYFDLITVQQEGGRAVIFENTKKEYMSADTSEGVHYMKLCK